MTVAHCVYSKPTRVLRANLRKILIASSFLAIATSACGQETPVKRALLIGIDDYQSTDISDLQGAVNDVEMMKNTLIGKFEFPDNPKNIRVLLNEQATKDAILDAIRTHLIEADPKTDIAVIHYSGHGSQMPDTSGDELDGLDETIVPYDSRLIDKFDISDDELNAILNELAEVTPNVTFIMDSCHSGSLARAAEVGSTVRQAPRDDRNPPTMAVTAESRDLLPAPGSFRVPLANYVLISGSQANELSHEGVFGQQRNGALTYYFNQALRSAGKETTFRDIMDTVRANVSARYPTQHPDFEGTSLDREVFGIRSFLPKPFVLVEPATATTVTVSAGDVYGMEADTILNVFPPGTKNFDVNSANVAEVRVTNVRDFDSDAEIIGGGPIAEHSRAILNKIGLADSYVGVYFDNGDDSPRIQAIKNAIADHESLQAVNTIEDAQLRVYEENDEITIKDRDLVVLSAKKTTIPNVESEIVSRLAHWGRWYAILGMKNPSPEVDVDVRIHRMGVAGTEPAPQSVADGTRIGISVTNSSDVDLYVVVLGLSPDGSVCVLYPSQRFCQAADQSDVLQAGSTLPIENIPMVFPDTYPANRSVLNDVVKVIATTEKISGKMFELGPAPRSARASREAGDTPFTNYVRRTVMGQSRNFGSDGPVDVQGWVTRERFIEVHRATVSQPSYALHLSDDDVARGTTSLPGARNLCSQPSDANCYEVEALQGDASIVEIRTPASRGAADLISVGEAFEEAYRLRDETGALRVEPMFDMAVSGIEEGQSSAIESTRGGSGPKDDPRAENDALWSLKHVRAMDAWLAVQTKHGRAAGKEAEGIVVAHPDTGYRQHAEISTNPLGDPPIWPEMGYDYFQDDDDPTDELLRDRKLDNPGHGTGSGSAIISPADCQLGGVSKCPTAISLGARLVPLRVNRSVILLSQKSLTRAIIDASGPDRTRVKTKSDVMSISMGGVPSWSLWKAVKKAEERGYLIIAAGGNYVRTVVWPARFKSVIGVAATNVGCKPWAHTSRGRAIDFSAPGESVWRAQLDDAGSPITSMGTGTTYATATTASVAALWFAYHDGDTKLQEIVNDGKLTQTFRELVQRSSWRPGSSNLPVECDDDARWNARRMGAGIIDAAALIAEPLDSASGSRSLHAAKGILDLPLWASMYDDSTAPSVIESDYRNLFQQGDPDSPIDLQDVAIFEAEVLHHYTMNDKVMSAIDNIILGGRRSTGAFAVAAEALRATDLSNRLRATLR